MEEKAKQQKRKIRRRYQCFINLAEQPDYAPQYALTSYRRRNQEKMEESNVEPSGELDKASSKNLEKGSEDMDLPQNQMSSSTNDADMDYSSTYTPCAITARPSLDDT